MEASGSNAKTLTVTVNGEPVRTMVISEGDKVVIGGAISFKRSEFLFAIGLNQGDLRILTHGVR